VEVNRSSINYSDWSAMMHVMLRARGMWAAIKEGATNEVEDQMAMEALLCGMPLKMVASLASKPPTMTAWDQLESSRLGSNRARMAMAQHVRRQYENIAFHEGESLDDFALCLTKMVHEMEILGDLEEPRKVAAKYLRVIPNKYTPVAVSIESMLDISTMTIDKIIGRLRAVEGRGDEEDEALVAGGKLLLIEEQWQARMKEKQQGESSSKASSGKGGSKSRPRGQRKKKGAGGKDDRNTCLSCSKKGHWAKDCRAP
jgi:hypothetical protein